MSTSPTSERTALLWGRQWWVAGSAEPLRFGRVSEAAAVLARHWGSGSQPTRLRLVFQPEGFASVSVECPMGSRGNVREALGASHPALTQPGHAWSFEPVLPKGAGSSTILHYEEEPALFSLIGDLRSQGIRVVEAWPLYSYLQALPTEWSESGGATVVAVQDESALAYHHPAEGPRTVMKWEGPSVRAEVAAWLRREAKPDGQLLVVGELDEELPEAGRMSFEEALGARVTFPRDYPAQLVPPAPLVTPDRVAAVASMVLLIVGLLGGTRYGLDWLDWQRERTRMAEEKRVLRDEIAAAQTNVAEIERLRAALAGPGSSPPVGPLLRRIAEALPREMVLQSLHVDRASFVAKGHVAPSAQPTVFTAWREALAAGSSGGWTFAAGTPEKNGAFALDGRFAP